MHKANIFETINQSIPSGNLTGYIFRIALTLFVIAIPFYIYESYFSNTTTILNTLCSSLPNLTAADQQRISDAMNLAGSPKDTLAICTQLPVANTDINLTTLSTFEQFFKFPVPFLTAIFYFFATNLVVFASLAFMFWVVVEDKFPKLSKTFFRQYLACGASFLIATTVLLPTIASVQVSSLNFNAINNERLALDNRLLCSSDHIFELMSKQNAIPMSSQGYRLIELSNNRNGIVCLGKKLALAEQANNATIKYSTPSVVKALVNIVLLLLIPLFLVIFLRLFKKLLHKVANR